MRFLNLQCGTVFHKAYRLGASQRKLCKRPFDAQRKSDIFMYFSTYSGMLLACEAKSALTWCCDSVSSGSSGALSRVMGTYGHAPWCYFQSRSGMAPSAGGRGLSRKVVLNGQDPHLRVTGRCGVWRLRFGLESCSEIGVTHQQEDLAIIRLWECGSPPASPTPHPPPSYHNYAEHAGGCCLAIAQGPGLGSPDAKRDRVPKKSGCHMWGHFPFGEE